ncbi:MAG: DUF421 domain-containing protein [Clostridia bacterium]|nr:DUF421 domain-containing protein [Clostridia bacterium]
MEILHITYTSLGSLAVLFILTKLMGNKQISQITMFDYINGITIGSIAAEMATSLEDDFLKPLVAMTIYAFTSILISYVNIRSVIGRRFLEGKAIVILDDGKLYEENLKRAKLDINEFLTQCRNSGYFNIADIQTAVLEPNGKISFLPKASKRPATVGDLNLQVSEEKLIANVIEDGKIIKGNLINSGHDEKWLYDELKKQGMEKVEDVFLATCDQSGNLSVYVKLGHEKPDDVLE